MAADDIAGVYSMGGYVMDGGAALYMFEGGRYCLLFYGGMRVGNWERRNGFIEMSLELPEHHFVLYGRKNPNLKEEARIYFSNFQNGATFFKTDFDINSNKELKEVFNKNANCFSYPYIWKGPSFANVAFALKAYEDSEIVYFENEDHYNDFIIYFVETAGPAETSYAEFRNNKLRIDGGEWMEKSLFEEGEDLDMVKYYAEQVRQTDTIYRNAAYYINEEVPLDLEHYKYSEEKSAYISEHYEEGEEFWEGEKTFHRMNILYPFSLMQVKETFKGEIQQEEGSVFYSVCD